MLDKVVPKVLLVDDLKENRMIVKLSLKKWGSYEFLEASDGVEAIEVATTQLPHIILMDAIMPKMDGFEAIEILRLNPITQKIPIIMISSLDNHDDKVKVLCAGSSDFISKPFDALELIIRVNSLLSLYLRFLDEEKKLEKSNEVVKQLLDYDTQQQNIAKEKIDSCLVNDFDEDLVDVLYIPHDILSGDFYSIFKRDDGSKFVYIIDGQGHGISPALTVFAIASTINSVINKVKTLEELVDILFPVIKTFLGDIEQLSYTMIMISENSKEISYVSAGMYPILIKYEDGLLRLKSNNFPFMSFSENPEVKTFWLDNWDSLALYSDGIIEYERKENTQEKLPELFLKDSYTLLQKLDSIKDIDFDDDVTYIHVYNNRIEDGL